MMYSTSEVYSFPFLELFLENTMTAMTANDIFVIPTITEFSKFNVKFEVASKVLLLLLAQGRHFSEFDSRQSKYFLILPRDIHKSCIKNIANEQIFTQSLVLLDLNGDIPCEEVLLLQHDRILFVLLNFKAILEFTGVVDCFVGRVVDELDVGILDVEVALEGDLLQAQHLGIDLWAAQEVVEIFDVLYLAGLSDAIAVFFKPSPCIELHDFFGVLECIHEEEETANDGAGPSLAVVAVKYGYIFRILVQKLRNSVADGEEHIKGRRLVILPFIIDHIFEYMFIDSPATHIDGDVLAVMLRLQQFGNRIDIISIQFLKS